MPQMQPINRRRVGSTLWTPFDLLSVVLAVLAVDQWFSKVHTHEPIDRKQLQVVERVDIGSKQ